MTDQASRFATPRVAAGAVFRDVHGRLLLVHPTYKSGWEIPGGYVESGESPAAACRREVAEELGIDRTPGRMLAVDWAPRDHEGDKLLFLFDCGDLGADEELIRLDGNEVDRWTWVPLDELDDYVIPRLARRLRSACADTGEQPEVYLEHGKPL